ncbi:hypothetical protein [Halopseudomonas salegens]|uniref:CrfX protein n=1 Tax=Halopseudomonas salegens TaxID=1434072 RepID=A0A1H2F5Q1_9GAMM|nr:hypothetical protein [Halopseudomonas salegens]SDU02684.1 hypothetical protein SAMN05216210_1307 [Halopseudomonas salegens]
MSDPLEQRLKALMQQAGEENDAHEDERLDRVLHQAHLRGGIFDLLNLFARWGWVVSEGGARGLRHARPVSRANPDSSGTSDPSAE